MLCCVKDIRKLADVFMYAVVDACKEMAEVMRKCFLSATPAFRRFFISVQMLAGLLVSVFCDEDRAASDAFLCSNRSSFIFSLCTR